MNKASVLIASYIIIAFSCVDAIASAYAFQHCEMQELNPFFDFLLKNNSVITFFLVKMFLTCAGCMIFVAIADRRPRLVFFACVICICMYVYILSEHIAGLTLCW